MSQPVYSRMHAVVGIEVSSVGLGPAEGEAGGSWAMQAAMQCTPHIQPCEKAKCGHVLVAMFLSHQGG